MSIFLCNKIFITNTNCDNLVSLFSSADLLYCCCLVDIVSSSSSFRDTGHWMLQGCLGHIFLAISRTLWWFFYFHLKEKQKFCHLFPMSVLQNWNFMTFIPINLICEWHAFVIGILTPCELWAKIVCAVLGWSI